MPVSTRSQVPVASDDSIPADGRRNVLRNPHQGLKEKMRALTILYEQHKMQWKECSDNPAPPPPQKAIHNTSIHLLNSGLKKKEHGQGNEDPDHKENIPLMDPELQPTMVAAAAKNQVSKGAFPRADGKDNQIANERNHITLYSFPKKVTETAPVKAVVARKLSLGGDVGGVQSEGRFGRVKVAAENGDALETTEDRGSQIMVFVRLRPMAKKEKEAGARSCVKIVNKKDVYLTEFASETDYLRLKRVRGRHFCFDASFPDSTNQQEVYSTTTSDLVEGVLQGRNGSVFCYGATGAGKTYTMLGTLENPGVMVLAIKDLFSKIRQRSYDGSHSVQLSYLEVYNETVRDLLSPGRPLVLREDKQGIVASGLTQYRAYTTDEVMTLLQQGNRNRTTEPTRANETSSRSHAILQVVAEYKFNDSGKILHRVGKLSLIDLAGSERALATDQRSQRSIEGANINRSLLALSSCINALVEGKKHIPYRNSKLTQLLKDSLGGPCNTVMIANISPSNLSFGETQNTLHWADRAKEIKAQACLPIEEATQVPKSEADQAKLVLELHKENSELRQQLVRQQQKLLTVQAQSLAAASPPPPASNHSPLFSTPSSALRKPKRSILPGNCFNTPESKSKVPINNETTAHELRKTVKALEAEMGKMKKEHLLQLKQKDDFIRDLITKYGVKGSEVEREKRVLTRASLRKGGERGGGGAAAAAARGVGDQLKSPSHRFVSPSPATKKRSFWDITNANSPSLLSVNGRKTRSHAARSETKVAPSMLLQPGFAQRKL